MSFLSKHHYPPKYWSIRLKMGLVFGGIVVLFLWIMLYSAISMTRFQKSFSYVVSDCTRTQELERVFDDETVLVDSLVRDPSSLDLRSFMTAQQQTQDLLSNFHPKVNNTHTILLVHAINIAYEQYQLHATDLVQRILSGGGEISDELLQSYVTLQKRSGYIKQYIEGLLRGQITLSSQIYTSVEQDIARLNKRIVWVSAATILVVAAAMWVVLFHFIAPVTKLSQAAEQVAEGEYDLSDLPALHRDEIGDLTLIFNRMRRHIQSTISALEEHNMLEQRLHEQEMRNMEMQHDLQNAQFRYLQSQINPHFLFNSLNAVSIYAQMEKAQVTEDLLIRLANIFRYYVQYNDEFFVSLSSEISLLQDYLTLQNIRFQGAISWHIYLDPQIEKAIIPKLVLQPLVENSIGHGFQATGRGHVSVDARHDGQGRINITITDNGCGFDSEKVLQPQGRSMGIANVVNRLKLFDPSYQFHIDSAPGAGTKISIGFIIRYTA